MVTDHGISTIYNADQTAVNYEFIPKPVDARLVLPFSYQLNAYMHQQGHRSINTHDLEHQIAEFYRGSGLPRAGRSMAQKVKEANEFLTREIAKSSLVGVGVSVVYDDSVVMAKGYGSLQANDSSKAVTSESLFQIASVSKTMIAIGYLEPEASLREKYAYSNTNYVILGQVIEGVSGQPWDRFLKERVWQPLGMNRTFASAEDVPSELYDELSSGHNDCVDGVTGPFDILTSPQMQLTPSRKRGLFAAGSIVSTPSDMTAFMRLLLNKGSVDGVKLFKSAATIGEMIRGKVPLGVPSEPFNAVMGFHVNLDGNTLASGYGFDTVGQVMWGRAYFDKGGDSLGHETRTGFVPAERLGVTMISNTEFFVFRRGFYLDQLRSYVMGIFLDVPKPILELEYSRWTRSLPLPPPFPGATPKNFCFGPTPDIPLSAEQQDKLIGSYESVVAPRFFPRASITRDSRDNTKLRYSFGVVTGTLSLVAKTDGLWSFLSVGPTTTPISATMSGQGAGHFELDLDFAGAFRKV
ncbi:hypothetical protein P43SY_007987 [Pythium insidiosum]|uniref:Beta-lactamase-related domain-containing protein n=1 Tax=Pythium insidiosum TaxID=114742 RepID=A0AAD5LU32_PYTIN|nr:hypothetical protein P43SY_007987 [Pythium insidiosum]